MVACMCCSKAEKQCQCHRYCIICEGDYRIRLCEDGYYYCQDCRDACEYRAEGETPRGTHLLGPRTQ